VPLKLDQRFHPRLIGQRGRNLRKVEEEYGVQIDMPNRNSAEPGLFSSQKPSLQMSITNSRYCDCHWQGRTEVLDCVDRLRSMEEVNLSDLS
jgi:hypothetical protein